MSRSPNNFHIEGYRVYHTPRPNVSTGGTAIYILNGIDHTLLPAPQTTHLETTTILVKINNVNVKVTSLYQPPSKPFFLDDYKTIFSQDVPTIVGGDFNAKHPGWHSRTTNTRGRKLHEFIMQHPHDIRIVSQPSPTFYSHQGFRPDVIDFFLTNRIEHDIDTWSISELQSDHNPVFMDIHTELSRLERTISTINWQQFNQRMLETLTTIPRMRDRNQIDDGITTITDLITNAVEMASKTKVIPKHSSPLPINITAKIREKNRIRRQWQRYRCPHTKTILNRMQTEIQKEIKTFKDSKWNRLIDNASQHRPQLWKLTKKFTRTRTTIPVIHGSNGLAFLAEDKAEAFAESLESQFSPNPLTTSDELLDQVEDAMVRLDRTPSSIPKATSPREVCVLIKSAPNKKAPGHDQISYTSLKNLPQKGIVFLTNIFNACLRHGYFPDAWKHAMVILIPKPGKNHTFPQNHRPISLLSTIGKLFEKVLHARLVEWTNDHLILPRSQHGFIKGMSCNHQLIRTTDYIINGLNRKQHSLAIFLDVAKAFDRVWHEGL